jgi:hypothetical protein
MKNILYKILPLILIVSALYFLLPTKTWTLSIYGEGKTISRSTYSTQKECYKNGKKRLDTIDIVTRFDCGYRCHNYDINDLEDSPICKSICRGEDCRN